jgi:hypothetical protein
LDMMATSLDAMGHTQLARLPGLGGKGGGHYQGRTKT